MGSHFLLQWIFLTQESSPDLLHCRQILYQLSYEGSPITLLQAENITIVKVVNSGFSQERARNVMLSPLPPHQEVQGPDQQDGMPIKLVLLGYWLVTMSDSL